MKIGVVGDLGRRGSQWVREVRAAGHTPLGVDLKVDAAKRADGWFWPCIDAVIIATPTDTHVSLLQKAVWYGLPVLVEKPVAPTFPEFTVGTRAMESLVHVAYSEVHSPAWRALRREMTLRDARVATASFRRYNVGRSTGADAIGDLMVHDLALARSLEPRAFDSATVHGLAVEQDDDLEGVDSAAAVMTSGGLSFWFEASRMATIDPLRRARVATTKGVLEVGLRAYTLTANGQPCYVDTRQSAMAATLHEFLFAIDGKPSFGVTLDQAYYIERAAEAVRRSAQLLRPVGGPA